MDGAMLPEDGWLLAAEGDDAALLIAPSRNREFPYARAYLERENDGWDVGGWGACRPHAVIEERSLARWEFAPGSYPPPRNGTVLRIRVSEIECSGGRRLKPEQFAADITYREETIEVVMTAPPLSEGARTCPGVSPTEYDLRLDEPVGGRKVVDAGTLPVVEPSPGTFPY